MEDGVPRQSANEATADLTQGMAMGARVDDLFDAELDGRRGLEPQRTGRGLRSGCLWVTFLSFGIMAAGCAGCLSGYFDPLFLGLPATPMTVARADQIFREGTQPGQSREAVEAWLASQGMASIENTVDPSKSVHYIELSKKYGRTSEPDWMKWYGAGDLAVSAGLRTGDVNSLLLVVYPDPERHWITHTEVWVFLYFDGNARLLRHLVHFYHYD